MQKNFETKLSTAAPSAETMALINRYTQKELKPEDVFIFSVILCDNEIDRDFERFSEKSLRALAPLFLGKTAIKNHSMDTDDQSARTFKTEVLTDASRKNSLGEAYTYLKADCYMLNIPKNADLIAEISAGIKKEVSVSCALSSAVCSVCGTDRRKAPCKHKAGEIYDDKLCFYTLEEPKDAYEWSFVAVPAQKNAGVTKQFCAQKFFASKKQAEKSCDISLKEAEFSALEKEFQALQKAAEDGALYKASLEDRFLKESAKAFPNFSEDLRKALMRNLSTKELNAACEAFKAARIENTPMHPQLMQMPSAQSDAKNIAFKF